MKGQTDVDRGLVRSPCRRSGGDAVPAASIPKRRGDSAEGITGRRVQHHSSSAEIDRTHRHDLKLSAADTSLAFRRVAEAHIPRGHCS